MLHEHSSIATKVDSPPLDAAIQRIASRQYGRITTTQLKALGLSSAGIALRVARGSLIPIHRGVYAVGHVAPSPDGDYMAAVLAAGRGAALSHAAAADIRGAWRHATPKRIDVIAPTHRRDHIGVVVHASKTLRSTDIELVRGIPTTTIPRTLLDLGDVLTPHQVAHALHKLLYDHRVSIPALRRMAGRGEGRRAGATLAQALEIHLHDSAGTRSDLEDRMLALAQRARVPDLLVNVWVEVVAGTVVLVPRLGRRVRPPGVWELDLYSPDLGVNVEVDGGDAHERPSARRADREQDAALRSAGVHVVRIDEIAIDMAERFGGLPRAVARALGME